MFHDRYHKPLQSSKEFAVRTARIVSVLAFRKSRYTKSSFVYLLQENGFYHVLNVVTAQVPCVTKNMHSKPDVPNCRCRTSLTSSALRDQEHA